MEIRKIAPEYRTPYVKETATNSLKEQAKFLAVTGAAVGAVALTHYKKPVADFAEKAYGFVSKPKFVQDFVANTKNMLKGALSPEAIAKLKNTGTAGKVAAVLAPIVALACIGGTAKLAYEQGKTTQKYIDKSNAQ